MCCYCITNIQEMLDNIRIRYVFLVTRKCFMPSSVHSFWLYIWDSQTNQPISNFAFSYLTNFKYSLNTFECRNK